MPKPKRITLQSFLNMVPWNKAFFQRSISDEKRIRFPKVSKGVIEACPICTVFNGLNGNARLIAIENGIAPSIARQLVNAADDYYDVGHYGKNEPTRTKTIRHMMLQRMKEAGVIIPEGVS